MSSPPSNSTEVFCQFGFAGPQCDVRYSDYLTPSVYNPFLITYILLSFSLSSIAFVQTLRLVHSKGFIPFSLQHIIYALLDYSCVTFLIRSIDPGGWNGTLPLLSIYLLTDTCTAAVYGIIFIVVMSWVKLLHIIKATQVSLTINLSPFVRFEKAMVAFLFCWTILFSSLSWGVHPSYIGDAFRTFFFIFFNIVFMAIGWYNVVPIYKTLTSTMDAQNTNINHEAHQRKKAQVAVVIKLMAALTLLSCGAIEILSWTVETNLVKGWDWRYNSWGPPHPDFLGVVEGIEFDCIQWVCLLTTLFFFRRFGITAEGNNSKGAEGAGGQDGSGGSDPHVNNSPYKTFDGRSERPSGRSDDSPSSPQNGSSPSTYNFTNFHIRINGTTPQADPMTTGAARIHGIELGHVGTRQGNSFVSFTDNDL